MAGGLGRQRANHLTRRHHLGRPARPQVGQIQPFQQRQGPAAMFGLIMPAHRDVVQAGNPAACQAQVQEILIFPHHGGARPDLGLMPFKPQRLGDHPFRADRPRPAAVEPQRRIAAGGDFGCLVMGAHIHPEQTGAQRAAIAVQRDHGAGGGVAGQRGDLVRRDPGRSHRFAHSDPCGMPPVIGVLLCLAGLGKLRGIRPLAHTARPPRQIKDMRPKRLCPAVDSDHIGHADHPGFCIGIAAGAMLCNICTIVDMH